MNAYAAWFALYDVLTTDTDSGTPVPELEHVERVYAGEPCAGDLAGPVSVTTVFEGADALGVNLSVRIYVQPGSDALLMQGYALRTVDAVENVLGTSSTFERANWAPMNYHADLDAFVLIGSMSVPREDF